MEERKLYFETYGCQMNVAASEVVAAILQNKRYKLVDKAEDADTIFLNTCPIRDNAEQRIWERLAQSKVLKRKKKNLVVGVFGYMADRVKITITRCTQTTLIGEISK